MLKTNTKKAKENIKNYIIKNYERGEDYTHHGINVDTTNWEEIRKNIKDIFYLEYGRQIKLYKSEYDAFNNWCRGLPSILDTCYYYNRSAIKDLGDILEETEEERNKYSEEQAEEKLTQLIYREVF